ncbi:MAG: serine hydrolase [Bacteroidales bacterium]|nr:serine hydrolase [Bacteroidales bacterium]
MKMSPKAIIAILLFFILFFGEIAITFSFKAENERSITSSMPTPFPYNLNNSISTNDLTVVIDSIMQEFLLKEKIKGASVAITKNGKLTYAKGFGFADEENNIRVEPKSLFG